MNHRKCNEGLSMAPYRVRAYVLAECADEFFFGLTSGNHTSCLNGYCIDALDQSPAGSMVSCTWGGGRSLQSYTPERGVTLAEHEAMIAEVDAILKEADERR